MLRGGEVNDIIELKRQGLSVSQISAMSGYDRKTIRKYLGNPKIPVYKPRISGGSKLEPFYGYLSDRMSEGAWNAVVLFREIVQLGYTGKVTILRMWMHPQREQATQVAVRRFETPAGYQAQVDWGEIGSIDTDAGPKKLYCFVYTLGHSRAMFADVTTDTRIGTLLRMHHAAFHALGGVPREILYDRMKTVVLGIDERHENRFHPLFADFSAYWGFSPRACRAYRPQTKGKVENGVSYIRKNFLCGRHATSLDDLRTQLNKWIWDVANNRIHGTTFKHVHAHWMDEKPNLLPLLGRSEFPFASHETRQVSRDAFVSYRGNRYSVPWRVAGLEVQLREMNSHLQVVRSGELLAMHLLSPPGSRSNIVLPQHHDGIPLGSPSKRGKAKIHIASTDRQNPVVEVRSLAFYEPYIEPVDTTSLYVYEEVS